MGSGGLQAKEHIVQDVSGAITSKGRPQGKKKRFLLGIARIT